MKSDGEIMEILAAYDLPGSFCAAAEHAGPDPPMLHRGLTGPKR